MRVTNAQGYDEPRDSISHDWASCLASWGMTLLPVPNLGEGAVDYVNVLAPDLLILSGGEDIGVAPLRDVTETALLEFALGKALPVLGVCRGLQLINSHLGGKLHAVDGHVARSHSIEITPAWQDFYGTSCDVNSFHNVGIAKGGLAAALDVTGTDERDFIEAAQHRTRPVAGVMWHPERRGAPEGDRLLLNALISGRTA